MERTLLKGLLLLEALAARSEPRGVTDLARELGLAKSNVHRLLRTLAHLKYVRQDEETSRYECTLKVWNVGSALIHHPAMHQAVETLAARTSETVHLAVLDDIDVLWIDKIESLRSERSYSMVGGRAPAHCLASGKCLLAHAPERTLSRAIAALRPFTPRTISEPKALEKELQRIRKSGYAVSRGEWLAGSFGLAAPIFDRHRRAVAAIGISGAVDWLTLSRQPGVAALVMEAARLATRAIQRTK